MNEHRHIAKKQFCPGCDHFHEQRSNVPGAVGVCLKDPPTVFVIGMVQSARSAIQQQADAPQEMVPVIRAYFPPVNPTDTCAQWTPRAEGEA